MKNFNSPNEAGSIQDDQRQNLHAINPLLDLNAIKNEIDRLTQQPEAIPHKNLFSAMLEKFHEIDFESKVAMIEGSENPKVREKHHLILVVEEILKVASQQNWGLRKHNEAIYIYNGCYWENTNNGSFQKFLSDASQKMKVPFFQAKYFQFREKLYKQFMSEAYLPAPDPPKDQVLINLMNGTLEVTPNGRKLRPFDRNDFLTYQLPFSFDENAPIDIFQKYLDRVLPDKQRQQILAEYLGLVFIRHGSSIIKEEKALILYGTGANGKSVFFEVVNALLGSQNICNYTLKSLTNELGYYRARLGDKLVNYSSELNGINETNLFKQMVSGEPIEARLPYCDPFIMLQYARLIFNCNELPREIEHTNAYFRRFLIIPFDVTIPEDEQDKMLHHKIINAELPGVLNWVLEGLYRLLNQNHFSECKASEEALEQYKTESDSVRMFMESQGYKPSNIHFEKLPDLYLEYKNICFEDGFRPVSKPNFKKRLIAMNIAVSRINIGNVVYIVKDSL